MNKTVCHIAILLLVCLLAPVGAAAEILFPDSRVEVALSGEHTEYLGLADGESSFRFSDIKADYLLFNVFSLYCPPCQRGAPDFNEMYEKIATMGLADRIKFVGLAAGNTVRETEHWRKKFNVSFPLIPDEDYVLHESLNNVGTPFFALVRVNGPDKLNILFSLEGAFTDKDAFFATILSHAGERVPVSE